MCYSFESMIFDYIWDLNTVKIKLLGLYNMIGFFFNCVEMCLSQQWRKCRWSPRPDNYAIIMNNKNSHRA